MSARGSYPTLSEYAEAQREIGSCLPEFKKTLANAIKFGCGLGVPLGAYVAWRHGHRAPGPFLFKTGVTTLTSLMTFTAFGVMIVYGINNILYQRGIYPTDTFKKEKKYGLPLFVSADPKFDQFLAPCMANIQQFLEKGLLKKLVIVIQEIKTMETLERWEFNIDTSVPEKTSRSNEKDEKKIRAEMQSVMMQITASVTFLPLLEVPCSFDILIYIKNNKGEEVPVDWSDSDAHLIKGAEEVKLRSFSTSVHTVATSVQYKMED